MLNVLEKRDINAGDDLGDFKVWPVNEQSFSSFSRCALRHNYHNHPMFQLDALEGLANFLYEKNQCRFLSPDAKIDSEFFHHSRSVDNKSLKEVFENINIPRSWIALYNIQVQPDYDALLQKIIHQVRPIIEREQGHIFMVSGFIFISAPPSVTPYHIDRENNFWLQIKGKKTLSVFDCNDRDLVNEKAVEDFIVYRNLSDVQLREGFRERGNEYQTSPGDGVYFPSTSPHMTETTTDWVTPDDGVSISIGVVFYTEHTRHVARVHQCNSVMRSLGLKPKGPGNNVFLDNIKAPIGYLAASFKSRLRGYDPPPGSY